MCSNLIKLGDNETFEKITSLMLIEILNKVKLYNKEQTSHNYFLIKNYLIFFMIVTINLKNFPSFVKTIFMGKKHFFKTLIDSINTITRKRKKEGLFSILNYLFLEEYKELYFSKNEKEKDNDLMDIFVEQQLFFTAKNLKISAYDTPTYEYSFTPTFASTGLNSYVNFTNVDQTERTGTFTQASGLAAFSYTLPTVGYASEPASLDEYDAIVTAVGAGTISFSFTLNITDNA
jgi:hypothetical protein